MRRGLVMTGLAFVALGMAVVGVGLVNLPTTTEIQQSSPLTVGTVLGHDHQAATLNAPANALTSGSVYVSFVSSAPVTGYVLSTGGSCATVNYSDPGSSSCIVASTSGAVTSGSLSVDPAVHFPYILDVVNAGKTNATLDGSIVLVADLTIGISWWEDALIFGAGGILAALGGVAIFLGFFLRGNPYPEHTMPEVLPEEDKGAGEGEGSAGSKGDEESEDTEGAKEPQEPKKPAAPAAQEPQSEEKTLW